MAEPAYKFRLYCTRCESWDHTKLVQGNERLLLWCERCQTFSKHLDEEHSSADDGDTSS